MNYARSARTLLEAGELDGVLMTGYFGGYSQYSHEFAEQETEVGREIARAVAESGRPLVAQTMYHDAPPNAVLREGGVPVYATIEAAVAGLAALLPVPAERVGELPAAATGPVDDSYFGSRELLAAAGVPFAEARLVKSEQQALEAADELGYPVVLKALGMLHKSDEGGVKVGIADAEALAWEWGDMQQRLVPPECSVEAMAPLSEGVELIIGIKRDLRFGPVVMVGIGGVFAELMAEKQVALAPVDHGQALRLIRSLNAAPLLDGARGRAPVDLAAAADALVAVSRLAAARPDIAEIDLNPLLVTPDGALGLDARVIPAQGGVDAG
jgi:acyl-CoA synthetase (NDP forming)